MMVKDMEHIGYYSTGFYQPGSKKMKNFSQKYILKAFVNPFLLIILAHGGTEYGT
jgi:hypothetical protein